MAWDFTHNYTNKKVGGIKWNLTYSQSLPKMNQPIEIRPKQEDLLVKTKEQSDAKPNKILKVTPEVNNVFLTIGKNRWITTN